MFPTPVQPCLTFGERPHICILNKAKPKSGLFQISPRWNALCHEYLARNRKYLPKIDEMILDFASFYNGLIWLRFQCPDRYVNYLGINKSQVISKNNGFHKIDCVS